MAGHSARKPLALRVPCGKFRDGRSLAMRDKTKMSGKSDTHPERLHQNCCLAANL